MDWIYTLIGFVVVGAGGIIVSAVAFWWGKTCFEWVFGG